MLSATTSLLDVGCKFGRAEEKNFACLLIASLKTEDGGTRSEVAKLGSCKGASQEGTIHMSGLPKRHFNFIYLSCSWEGVTKKD